MSGKIYTKKGDKGTTGTFLGRMSKSDQLTKALGTVDELNSWVGVCRNELLVVSGKWSVIDRELRRIQKNLLTIGSSLAGSGLKINGYETNRLEKLIDTLTEDLPKLENFIYPTGLGGAAYLQIARTIARKAEREVVAVQKVPRPILKYLNRLSDAIFTIARWVNLQAGGQEEVWEG